MFRVTFFCEDKNLGALKRQLAQAGAKDVQDEPVVNVELVGGQLRPKTAGGTVTERVHAELIKAKHQTVDLPILRGVIEAQGARVAAVYSTARRMVEEGKLRKLSGVGRYKVISPRIAKAGKGK